MKRQSEYKENYIKCHLLKLFFILTLIVAKEQDRIGYQL